jgi:SOS regulatory protein LexA
MKPQASTKPQTLRLLGSITAGQPFPQHQQDHESLVLDDYLVSNWQASYLLRIYGDSMIEAGIREGDLAVIDGARQPRNGDLVAACLDGEWTLKQFKKAGHTYVLLPANKRYLPLYPRKELTIGGVVTSVIRKYH